MKSPPAAIDDGQKDVAASDTQAGRIRRFRIGEEIVNGDDARLTTILTAAYRARQRPFCQCQALGVPMYIARIGDQLVIKRMPLSGGDHDHACPSYEPPYELTGLGGLMGIAIKPDAEAGTAAVRLDFSLSKRGPAGSPPAGETKKDSVKNEGKRLSLRALLHLLWHESGLTEWTANWTGKRHWWQVYHHLLEAGRTLSVRGEALSERLYVPEPFRAEDKAAIEQRRARAFASLIGQGGGAKRLMLLVGEVKQFGAARSGQQVVIKHMPGFRLFIDEAAWRRLQRRFETELALWRSDDRSHLIAIATIEASAAGLVMINEIAIMTVTGQWLPIENAHEERLLERLTRLRRKTVKGLRFDLPPSYPIANAILPEARPRPVAFYVIPPNADDQFETLLNEMIEARWDMSAWIWRVAEGDVPALPWELKAAEACDPASGAEPPARL